jgi:hypothetical protein
MPLVCGLCLGAGVIDVLDADIKLVFIESVLGTVIAGTFAFELAVDLLLGLGFLQNDDLGFGQHEALLRHLGFQRLETPFSVRQIVAQPYCAHPEGRDRQALLLQLVGNADLWVAILLVDAGQRLHRSLEPKRLVSCDMHHENPSAYRSI